MRWTWRGSPVADHAITPGSPLYRCVQTATPVAEALDLPILIEPGLGECRREANLRFGNRTHARKRPPATAEWYLPVRRGLHPAPATPSLLQKHFPRVSTDPAAWEPLLTPPRVGESMRAIHHRCARFAPLLSETLRARGYSRAIVFTHAATAIALCRALAGDVRLGDEVLSEGATEPGQAEQLGLWKDEERLPVAAATCSVSKFASEGDEWQRLWDGRTDFLERGEEVRSFNQVRKLLSDE